MFLLKHGVVDWYVVRGGAISSDVRRGLGDHSYCRLWTSQRWIFTHLRHIAV